MDLKKHFGTDTEKEISGVWHDLGEAKLLIARAGNPNFKKEFKRLTKPYQQMMLRGTMPEDLSDKIVIATMAKTVLLGWENLEDDGKKLKYSTENAVKILTKYKDFRELVSSLSQEMEAYKEQNDEDIEGN